MLFSSYNEIPKDYVKVWEVDMMKNKKFAALINIAALVITIVMITVFCVFYPAVLKESLSLFHILALLGGFIVSTILHELIHGLFFKLGTKEKLKIRFNLLFASASVPTVYFKKWHYFIVGLAPFIILDSIFIGLCFVLAGTSWLFVAYVILAVHTGGCIGDFYISYKLLRAKSDIIVNDKGTAMTFYSAQ